MLIFDYIYIFGFKLPTIAFFVAFGLLFWFFVMWRESRKDGFLHNRLFDISILLMIFSALMFLGFIRYYNWFSIYKPHNWLLKYNRYIVYSTLYFLLNYIVLFVFSKKNRWSVYRILDIYSTSINFFLFSFTLGAYLIYGNTDFILCSVLLLAFYVLFLRLRGYYFKSGYLFSFYTIFISILVASLFRETGYLIFCTVLSTIGILNFVLRRQEIMDKKSLPKELIDSVKSKLKAKDAKLVQEELLLKKEDPYFKEGRTEGNADEIDEAVLEDSAKNLIDTKLSMIGQLREQIAKALSRINLGKYGKCESCGKSIDKARLKAYPEATTCLKCASKFSE